MKKNYLLPRQNVVEIDEMEMLCNPSGGTLAKKMRVEMNDYDTYEDKPRSSGLDWSGTGTGSDF